MSQDNYGGGNLAQEATHRTGIYSSRASEFSKEGKTKLDVGEQWRVWSNEGNCKRNNAIMATRRGLGQVRSLGIGG